MLIYLLEVGVCLSTHLWFENLVMLAGVRWERARLEITPAEKLHSRMRRAALQGGVSGQYCCSASLDAEQRASRAHRCMCLFKCWPFIVSTRDQDQGRLLLPGVSQSFLCRVLLLRYRCLKRCILFKKILVLKCRRFMLLCSFHMYSKAMWLYIHFQILS